MFPSNSESIIDWLSFSIPVYAPVVGETRSVTFSAIKQRIPVVAEFIESRQWEETSGRAPYDRSYTSRGWRIFAGVGVEHIAIEVSGVGCKDLRKQGIIDGVLAAVYDRLSRIDIAVDIETDILPTEFIGAGYSGRIRTVGQVVSDSGETVYVGSQKSDRYCRVYRYNEPHPRSDLLRIEYVFRRKEAKSVGLAILGGKVRDVAAQANTTYKWEHGIMKNLKAVSGLTANVAHRSKAKTLQWLIKQVAPAFRQLVKDGVIENPQEFVSKYFEVKKDEN